MKVKGKNYTSIWLKEEDEKIVQIIDQRSLPHEFIIEDLKNVNDTAKAIKEMHVRGAPLIGTTAAFGMYLAALEAEKKLEEKKENNEAKKEKTDELDEFNLFIQKAAEKLIETRPTAIDLEWAVKKQLEKINRKNSIEDKKITALKNAKNIANTSAEQCKKIGEFGFKIIKEISEKKRDTVNILTHCNAGWLACVDYGTATAPIYKAFEEGIDLHVWVDETRPRNQGARLTAWELLQQGIKHSVIVDNAGGHLMQKGMVDLCIVGTDRTTFTGDVANKIGTYLKALAAKDNNIPFYVALPSSTIDWELREGKEIPIEERDENEVKWIQGFHSGQMKKVLLTPEQSPARNYAFDVTPRRLITGLITERGICQANEKSILDLFPEKTIGEIE
ncbi:S-methyl-5-thioribose-1-phosphate isomerase [Candidatus Micrarchaeota archaeon]|nr:S-methyl-5-thioribose-1-phosphate isomerase [Candidatus Micrarchaeota archaeon]MBU2477154.1 S-methyl-5-thioribose-1-phosphate isomerase [Candidatus Micrarchaeota archaeon]